MTATQQESYDRTVNAIKQLTRFHDHIVDEAHSSEDNEAERRSHEDRVDQSVLALCVSFITHRLQGSRFDSGAVFAWDGPEGMWMKQNDYSSYLSHPGTSFC